MPDQIATVGTYWWGTKYPIDLSYEIPVLPPHLMLIGDIHSHVNGPAFASLTDKADEQHQPGLHLVVGRIGQEPPEFHCEVLADGMRFQVQDLSSVMEGYRSRQTKAVPAEWLARVKVKPWSQTKPGKNGRTKTDTLSASAAIDLALTSNSTPNAQKKSFINND